VLRWAHRQKEHLRSAEKWAEDRGGTGSAVDVGKLFEDHHLRITLRDTAVTDSDLKFLSDQTDLFYLDLANTQITDAGLKHLHHAKELKILDLRGTRVTAKGAQSLRNMLPNLVDLRL
jgi:hypothetical protein